VGYDSLRAACETRTTRTKSQKSTVAILIHVKTIAALEHSEFASSREKKRRRMGASPAQI